MFNTLERITELRKDRGWGVYRLAKETGIPQSTIATWYQKNLCPPIDKIELICNSMNLLLSDFFSTGNQIALTPENKELFDKWSCLTKIQQDCVMTVINNMLGF